MEEWKRKVGFKRGIFVFHNLAYYVIRGGGDIRFFLFVSEKHSIFRNSFINRLMSRIFFRLMQKVDFSSSE